jgi:hypothetical protein
MFWLELVSAGVLFAVTLALALSFGRVKRLLGKSEEKNAYLESQLDIYRQALAVRVAADPELADLLLREESDDTATP